MKKIIIIYLLISLCFLYNDSVNAETLNEYIVKAKAELNKIHTTSSKRTMTEKEKKETVNKKQNITKEISKAEQKIENLKKDIESTKNNIEIKEKEIKKIISFTQISDDNNNYLEYIMGAKDFTDLIYRIAIAEQLSEHNDKIIENYNEQVIKLETDQKKLKNEELTLTKKETELENLVAKLSKEIEDFDDTIQTSTAELDNLNQYIQTLKDMGCKQEEDIKECENKMDAPSITTGPTYTKPAEETKQEITEENHKTNSNSDNTSNNSNTNNNQQTNHNNNQSNNTNNNTSNNNTSNNNTTVNHSGFYMPLDKGKITSNYGYRQGGFHNALDLSNYEGAPVYAVTSGRVITVSHNNSCGRNIVYILHNVNGKNYTTVYYHLKSAYVKSGDLVTYKTQIGIQGGNPSYDSCTTGSHLDLKLFTGRYLKDFFSLSKGPHQDPRNWLKQAPAKGKYFYNR